MDRTGTARIAELLSALPRNHRTFLVDLRSRGMFGAGFLWADSFQRSLVESTQGGYAALYLLRGRGWYEDERGERFNLTPGLVLRRHAGEGFRIFREPDGTWLEFALRLPDSLVSSLARLGFIQRGRRLRHPGLDEGLISRCAALAVELGESRGDRLNRPLLAALALENDFNALDEEVREGDGDCSRDVAAARDLLRGEAASGRPVRDILDAAGLGYERIRKRFAREFGLSPKAYWLQCRLNLAQGLLDQTELSVKEIAFKLNYPDPSVFVRQFKKHTAQTPAAYRLKR